MRLQIYALFYIQLAVCSYAQNLLANPSFEDASIFPWKTGSYGIHSLISNSADNNVSYSGVQSVEVISEFTPYWGFYRSSLAQIIHPTNCSIGSHTFSIWARTAQNYDFPVEATVLMGSSAELGGFQAVSTEPFNLTTQWIQLKVSSIAMPSSSFEVHVQTGSHSPSTVYFDTADLSTGNPLQDYSADPSAEVDLSSNLIESHFPSVSILSEENARPQVRFEHLGAGDRILDRGDLDILADVAMDTDVDSDTPGPIAAPDNMV